MRTPFLFRVRVNAPVAARFVFPLLAVLFLSLPLFAAPKAGAGRAPEGFRNFNEMGRGEIDALLFRAARLPLDERISFLSGFFLNTPYAFDPLGEGDGASIDPDPVFRLDRIDCLTFLEELWGMLGAKNLRRAEERTQWIRYDGGTVGYRRRHHFTWAQWLERNEAAGYVRDVTREAAGDAAVRQTKTLKSAKHCGGRWESFCERLGDRFPAGSYSRDILPLERAIRHPERIPANVFLFVVLEDRPSLPYRVKHAGLVLDGRKGRKILRHASKNHQRIVDVNLLSYLNMLQKKNVNWPASGLILVRPVPDTERPAGDTVSPPAAGSALEGKQPPAVPEADQLPQ